MKINFFLIYIEVLSKIGDDVIASYIINTSVNVSKIIEQKESNK